MALQQKRKGAPGRFGTALAILTLLALLPGCVGLRTHAPSVTVADIRLAEATLFEQRYILKLRVLNPNDFDIPVTGMSFEIRLNDQPFARGVSPKALNLPRFGEALVEVSAVSDLSGVIRQLGELGKGHRDTVGYRIVGRLNGPSYPDLTFESGGTIGLPGPLAPPKRAD